MTFEHMLLPFRLKPLVHDENLHNNGNIKQSGGESEDKNPINWDRGEISDKFTSFGIGQRKSYGLLLPNLGFYSLLKSKKQNRTLTLGQGARDYFLSGSLPRSPSSGLFSWRRSRERRARTARTDSVRANAVLQVP